MRCINKSGTGAVVDCRVSVGRAGAVVDCRVSVGLVWYWGRGGL